MLWTHFGVSGPLVLDASGIWTRARSENKSAEVFFNFWPGCSEETVLAAMQSLSTSHPRGQVGNSLAQLNRLLGVEPFAERFVVQVLSLLQQDGTVTLAHWPREARQLLIRQLMLWRLPVRETRGYNYAEVTAGGVPLREVEIATMQSRCCPGLFLVGEILDVDGRIGGFNFQWAWSSGYVAAQGLAQL
ncbi:MAG: hypothetical protein HJJLKODD_00188 [Phycisphaerae bacterium]|nr:hypothetical protein [Phycisphaerae bacterium]